MNAEDQRIKDRADKFRKKYTEICLQMKKPQKTEKVYKKSKHYFNYEADCWVNNDSLFILTSANILNKRIRFSIEHSDTSEPFNKIVFQKIIPLSQIHHFQREGEVYTETKISGGGGGGSSIAGAVVGGFIAGG